MSFDASRYLQGYSIGVGAVVMYGNKVLLVRSALGSTTNEWMIPGGFVERNETIDSAVRREVWEETGVRAEVVGLIGARSRVIGRENSVYLMFLMQASSEETRADGVEVAEARYVTLAEMQALPRVRALSKMVVSRVLEGRSNLLAQHPHPDFSPQEFVLYL
jgi:ADP-ribose pyrophosphatase YjhB (NUDIX family)